jgi:hypothetical protein
MLEFLLEVVGELLLQVVVEVLAQIGLHCLNSLAEPFRKPPNPWFAAVGYTLLGAIAGGLSLLVFPAHLVKGKTLRRVSLVATPVVVGFVVSAVGVWLAKRGQTVLRIDRFFYGFLFALSLALVRFWFAQ